jgi:ABC-type lipoprotein release transport system permease subunit
MSARALAQPQAAAVAKGARTTPLWRLAWRNIWRQRRRTALLLIVVAYATLSTVFFWGFIDGFVESVLYSQARLLSAPVLIATPAYQDDPDPANALPSLDSLAALPPVDLAPRLDFFALLRSPYAALGAQVRGIDPGLEPAVSDIPRHIHEGRLVAGPGEVVLGKTLAEQLDVRLGERLVLDVSALAGPQAAGLIAVGLIDSGLVAIDGAAVLIHLDDARRLTGVATATAVAVDAPRGQESAVATRLGAFLPPGVQAYSLMELLSDSVRFEVEGSRLTMIPMIVLFAVFAALAVTSTVLVSVLERARELGMMAAIGLAPRHLSRMVVIEAVLVTTIGWLVGLALGYGLVWVFGTWNILGPVFASAGEAFAELGLPAELYTAASPSYALYALVTVALAAAFALLIPARRVARLNPVEAMRTE